MAISYEQVASAAESIKAEGGKPTLAAIHARLGSGSMSTITKFMQRWKGEQPQQQTSEVVLPEQMKAAIIQEMERYASQRVAVVRDELDEATQTIESLTTESETLEDAVLHAEAEASKWRGLADDRKELAQRQEAEIQRLKGERSELKAAIECLTMDLATSRASAEILEREKAEMKELQKTLMDAQAAVSRLEAQKESLTERVGELKDEVKELKAQTSKG